MIWHIPQISIDKKRSRLNIYMLTVEEKWWGISSRKTIAKELVGTMKITKPTPKQRQELEI